MICMPQAPVTRIRHGNRSTCDASADSGKAEHKMQYIQFYESPMGRITLAGNGTELTGLWFEGQKHYCSTLGREYEEKSLPPFSSTIRWLDQYFGGRDPGFVPELQLQGTVFRKKVWLELLKIPYGHTTTYGTIAQRLGMSPMAARAVGNAAGHNPISLIVPCHRVIGRGGILTGYAGGEERKAMLLNMEREKPGNRITDD